MAEARGPLVFYYERGKMKHLNSAMTVHPREYRWIREDDVRDVFWPQAARQHPPRGEAVRREAAGMTSVVFAAEEYAQRCVAASGVRYEIGTLIELKTWFYAGARWHADHPDADVVGPQSTAFDGSHPPVETPPEERERLENAARAMARRSLGEDYDYAVDDSQLIFWLCGLADAQARALVKSAVDPRLKWDVLAIAYDWTIATTGEVYGLVAGDQGFEATGIFIPLSDLAALKGSRDAEEGQTDPALCGVLGTNEAHAGVSEVPSQSPTGPEVAPPDAARLQQHDNHHNAMMCAYCNPQRLVLVDLVEIQAGREALQEEVAALRAQLATVQEERDEAQRYVKRSEQMFGVLQRLFGIEEIGDDPTEVFVIAEDKLKALVAIVFERKIRSEVQHAETRAEQAEASLTEARIELARLRLITPTPAQEHDAFEARHATDAALTALRTRIRQLPRVRAMYHTGEGTGVDLEAVPYSAVAALFADPPQET